MVRRRSYLSTLGTACAGFVGFGASTGTAATMQNEQRINEIWYDHDDKKHLELAYHCRESVATSNPVTFDIMGMYVGAAHAFASLEDAVETYNQDVASLGALGELKLGFTPVGDATIDPPSPDGPEEQVKVGFAKDPDEIVESSDYRIDDHDELTDESLVEETIRYDTSADDASGIMNQAGFGLSTLGNIGHAALGQSRDELSLGSLALGLAENLVDRTEVDKRDTQYVFDLGYGVPKVAAFVYVEEILIRDTVESALSGHTVDVEIAVKPGFYGDAAGVRPAQLQGTYQMI